MSVRRFLIVIASASLLLMAACSDDNTPSAGSDATGAGATGTTGSSESPASGGGQTEVEAEDSALGMILVDSKGNTLYAFMQDTGDTSTCTDDCASNWPALIAKGEVMAGGGGDVDASLLGTTTRDDGTTQVTYNGHPLYHFAGDQAPGDTNGQGIGDVWFVVSPAGDPIQG